MSTTEPPRPYHDPSKAKYTIAAIKKLFGFGTSIVVPVAQHSRATVTRYTQREVNPKTKVIDG